MSGLRLTKRETIHLRLLLLYNLLEYGKGAASSHLLPLFAFCREVHSDC